MKRPREMIFGICNFTLFVLVLEQCASILCTKDKEAKITLILHWKWAIVFIVRLRQAKPHAGAARGQDQRRDQVEFCFANLLQNQVKRPEGCQESNCQIQQQEHTYLVWCSIKAGNWLISVVGIYNHAFDRCGTLPCILSTYFYVLSISRYLVIVLVYIKHEKCYLYR